MLAGLLKGSTRAERPKTLRRLQNVYEQMTGGSSSGNISNATTQDDPPPDTSKTLSILSPFDEQEEWAKISEIMASFGTGLVRESVFVTELEREFQARLGEC